MDNNYWNEEYWKRHLDKNEKMDILDDLWIKKHEDLINSFNGKVLDLGCGIGQYTKYFLDKNFKVISADISVEALKRIDESIEKANTIQVDMGKKLPFEDNAFDIVFANLSIHFFDKLTTEKLVNEIKRITKNNGYFIGSVNSTKAYEFIKDHVVELEQNYYDSNGRNVRLFDKAQMEYFFKDFELVSLEEVQTIRFNKRKDMIEFIYQVKK